MCTGPAWPAELTKLPPGSPTWSDPREEASHGTRQSADAEISKGVVVMPTAPRAIRATLVLFNLSVVVAGAFGLVFIWYPPESETVIRIFSSVLVVFAACMLILGGYRTVHVGSKEGG